MTSGNYSRICSGCGKQGENYHENLCEDCFSVQHPLVDDNLDFSPLDVCLYCSSVRISGRWESCDFDPSGSQELENILRKVIPTKVSQAGSLELDLQDVKLFQDSPESLPKYIFGRVMLKGSPDPFLPIVTQKSDFKIPLLWGNCPDCHSATSGEYAAKLQIRDIPQDLDETIEEEIISLIPQITSKDERKAFISAIERVRKGIDVLLGSKKLALNLGEHYRKEACTKIEVTTESAGFDKQRQRPRRRLTILIRFLPYASGDLLQIKGKIHQFLKSSEGRVRLWDFFSQTEESIASDAFWDMPISRSPTLSVQKFQIVSLETTDDLQEAIVMNLDDYNTLSMDASLINDPKEGDEFEGVFIDSKIFPTKVPSSPYQQ